MSGIKYGSGKDKFIGQSIIYSFPIPLDATQYPGAAIVTDTGDFFFSDGVDWKIPNEDVDISRPSALVPTNSNEATQLRLNNFRSPGGFTQTGIFYEINMDGVADFSATANVETRQVTSTFATLYQVLYPEDGFQPGDTIWWRAKYLGSDATQSDFSLPFAQVFPDLIATPSPLTRDGSISGTVTVTPYDSPTAFGLPYYETVTEFYNPGDIPGVTTPIATVTQNTGASTTIPTSFVQGALYQWRSRYGGRINVGAPVVYSEWSLSRGVVPGGASMLLEYNLNLATSRTLWLPLGGTVNVSVNWGDGITETFTTAGIKSHVYASGVGPTVLVSITGTLTVFGSTGMAASQQIGLTRVENWGFGLGLTSLAAALYRTSANLTYVSPNLPETVTNLSNFMQNATGNPDLSALNTSNVTNMPFMFAFSTTFNQAIGGWDTSKVTNMAQMFESTGAFNQPIGAWNTGNVTNMYLIFRNAAVFNQNIGTWDMSKVAGPTQFFAGAAQFNNGGSPSINNWNTSSFATMTNMFLSAPAFNQPVGGWNTSNVTSMNGMFSGCGLFNQNLNAWNTANVTDMASMFSGCTVFNQPVGAWDTSKVTSMQQMFYEARAFNQPINSWNVSNVTNMLLTFFRANAFNQPLSTWDTSKVLYMESMFSQTLFDQDISMWDVSNVITMAGMFGLCPFNQPIGNWNVSKVTNFNSFITTNSLFNQDLSGWDLRPAGTTMTGFGGAGINEENYSRTLIGWANYVAANDGPYTVPFSPAATRLYNANNYVTGQRFNNAVAARAFLVGGRVVSVTGASDTNANTSYTFNAINQTYDASNGWKFAILGTSWGLYDASAVLQATGTGTATGSGPHTATSWTGVLSAATVLRTGATWTITGDAAA